MTADYVALKSIPCPGCGKTRNVRMTLDEAYDIHQGKEVDRVLMEHDAADREALITGICNPCWDKMLVWSNKDDT